jgi:hypothetical protein
MRRREFITALGGAALGAMAMSTTVAALEAPKPEPAHKFLGPAFTGTNYTVAPDARSDGIMRIFEVETPYGHFQFVGVEFARMRLHELQAVATLEKVSQSEAFATAFGRAALAPAKFGAELVTNPADTIGRSLGGVANMFDRFGAGVANNRADRDQMLDSLLGVSDSQRELAVELGVDPYSDFPPLKEKLKQVASALAGGGLPVKAGLAMIPGGVGLAVSSASSVGSAKETLSSKTAAQVIAEVRSILKSLDVPAETTDRFVENRNYTPADLLIMSRALAQLGAQNTAVFIALAAEADSRNVAFYQRSHTELLAARSAELGGIASFVTVAGHVVTVTRNGNVVAAFTFDGLVWTAIPQRTFRDVTAELPRGGSGAPVFATTGAVTPMAAAEIGKLGWKIVQLKPLR